MSLVEVKKLYSAEQCRKLDAVAIHEFGMDSYELMCRAGQASVDVLRKRWPSKNNILILCGSGNNGGDGFVMARLLDQLGLVVDVYCTADVSALKGDALKACRDLLESGLEVKSTGNTAQLQQSLNLAQVLVDALLGTGTTGELREPMLSLIKQVNQAQKPVLALDLPSGLCADTGRSLGVAINASMTITFIAAKPGLFSGVAVDYVGECVCDDLNLPAEVFAKLPSAVELIHFESCKSWLTPRVRSSHKGHFGHVLLIGGDKGMGGAIALAAEAALRVGAGLVSVACHPENAAMVTGRRPEVMCLGFTNPNEINHLIENASLIALGPGLGQSAWSQRVFAKIIEQKKLRVVDADALNFLAQNETHFANWILTPHPGEAARLLHCASSEVNNHRFSASEKIQKRYGGVVVLKGAGTLVNDVDSCGICPGGNPGMASGGMGDVLTGILAGLCAQFDVEQSLTEVARLAVCLHAQAADAACAQKGERGMLASDVIDALPALI